VTLTQQVMLISADGMMTRTPIKERNHGISTQGRSTQGVKVMDMREDDRLVAITTFDETDTQLPLADMDEDEEEAAEPKAKGKAAPKAKAAAAPEPDDQDDEAEDDETPEPEEDGD
jgi:DNA gyrase subunit A